ncbi:sulfide/dihydroorotate dehydrogenase-like FAD/NAD-binding protein [uncultured Clostridium sp.]|uniref:sulfide/dihydroorotate dehydrogenase-like FAD/NAD-binding protein n=1 Tax=uncultured Clostridium sp. TaxID=59620 RepID=UPI0028E42DB9|nr:sulfide/dihydroorotate dehydrogenase-like FAD/NAD-binding protein [uncultured Clostridium sp.]
MYEILEKELLAPNIYKMVVKVPRVAKAAKPGQFIIVRVDEKSERIPLTICDYDKEKETVTIVFQTLGASTIKMSKLEVGDYFRDFAGPLGKPSEFIYEDIEELKNKNIIFIAGGVGTAPIYPQIKWLNSRGINVDVIVGSKNKELLIMEEEIKKEVSNLYVATDDGSYGYKGLVTDLLKDLIDKENKKYDLVIAIGPMIMMKFITKLTKEYDIKTVVSLNTLMVDGTGMCGACRVTVGGETKFACVDGPEFDGHLVEFDEALRRQSMYKGEEKKKLLVEKQKEEGHICRIGLGGEEK